MAANEKYLTRSDAIFYAASGVSTYADVNAAWESGKQVVLTGVTSDGYYLYHFPAVKGIDGNNFRFSGTLNGKFHCFVLYGTNTWFYESGSGTYGFESPSNIDNSNLPGNLTSTGAHIATRSAVTKYIVEDASSHALSVPVTAITPSVGQGGTLIFDNNVILTMVGTSQAGWTLSTDAFFFFFLMSIGACEPVSFSNYTEAIATLKYQVPKLRFVARKTGTSTVYIPSYFNLTSTSSLDVAASSTSTSTGLHVGSSTTTIYIPSS